MPGKRARRTEVKVTIIETQYVETNSASFKSVVQKLTGKDSTAEDIPMPTLATAATTTGSWHAAAHPREEFGCCRGEDWFKALMKTSTPSPTTDTMHYFSIPSMSNNGSLMASGGSLRTTWGTNGEEDELWKLVQPP